MAGWWRRARVVAIASAAMAVGVPADAYLFWTHPAIAGAPASGDQPGIAMKLAGATATEQQANLIWTMRAGLNVAALQCQFAPALRTVENYNNLLHQHAAELQSTYAMLSGYFKRTAGKGWQNTQDQYTTRTYNSFSTLQAQVIFCETAASIGRETMERPRGQLGAIAVERMREFRNSLTPTGDAAFSTSNATLAGMPDAPDGAPQCTDRRGKAKKC